MERHERYDPEDIESLLSERAYDELLPDERSFVLRHLSDREEYERMRALLHYVRPDERERTTIEPDEKVRRSVLATFRAQQKPQWRIWLNTLAAWATPHDGQTSWNGRAWRPALAFGTVALLLVAGVVAVRQFASLHQPSAVAEVKHLEPATPQPTPEASAEGNAPDTNAPTEEDLVETVHTGNTISSEAVHHDAPTAMQTEATNVGAGYDTSYTLAEPDVAALAEAAAPAPPAQTELSESTSRVVTEVELARNESLSNATGAVAKDMAAKRSAAHTTIAASSRSMAQDPGILGLVAAGW